MREVSAAPRFLGAAMAMALLGCSGAGAEKERPREPDDLRVMTFNVLCWFCSTQGGQNYDPWETRLGYFEDLFARHDADLVGLQELSPKLTVPTDTEQLAATLPGFESVFYADDRGEFPDAAVYYRAARFELVERGDFWLSPTPDEPRSNGFAMGAQFPRLVVWAELRELATGRTLVFATTHFDNNAPSQELSAPLVKARAAAWQARGPVVLTGDFNSQPADPAFRTLTDDSEGYAFVETQSVAATWRMETNQAPAPDYDLAGRIDHVFVAGQDVEWTVDEWVVDTTVYGPEGKYPSDHLAIAATLRWE